MRGRLAVAFVTMAILAPGLAWGADPVAVLTEIQVRRGQVHVRPVGDNAWSAPKPLQSLRFRARTHEHIRNQRLDFARKLSKELCARFDLIAHEDLNIARRVDRKFG